MNDKINEKMNVSIDFMDTFSKWIERMNGDEYEFFRDDVEHVINKIDIKKSLIIRNENI